MTHLEGNVLVFKDHPRIAFRGLDRRPGGGDPADPAGGGGEGYGPWPGELEEVLGFVRRYIRFDVLDEPVGSHRAVRLYAGAAPGVLPTIRRNTSASPTFWPAIPTDPPCWWSTSCAPWCGRPSWPPTPPSATRASNVTRGDMILGLNRLSSLMWIFMIKLKAGRYERK